MRWKVNSPHLNHQRCHRWDAAQAEQDEQVSPVAGAVAPEESPVEAVHTAETCPKDHFTPGDHDVTNSSKDFCTLSCYNVT